MALFVHTYVRTPVACMYVCTYALTHLDILFNEFFVVADEFNEEHLNRRHINNTYVRTYVHTYVHTHAIYVCSLMQERVKQRKHTLLSINTNTIMSGAV